MVEDVARLELSLIAGLLENEILGEVLAVVADVKSREENVPLPSHRARRRRACAAPRATADRTAHGSHQLMSHAYSRKTALIVLAPDLLGEQRFVERREIFADEERHVDVARQLDRPIVRRLDAAVAS